MMELTEREGEFMSHFDFFIKLKKMCVCVCDVETWEKGKTKKGGN